MSEFDQLMKGYVPPPVPPGLADRAVAAATAMPQDPGRAAAGRRINRRWTRPLWIGAASFGVAFTSAVAATVVSSGRIEIPVVQQVVEAIPVLNKAVQRDEPVRVARKIERPVNKVEAAPVEAKSNPVPAIRNERARERIAALKQEVERRRAAGLPTPRADRIEARIAKVRQRAEIRDVVRNNPAALTDEQVAAIVERLPPARRQWLQSLPPERQRQVVIGTIERLRERRARRLGAPDPIEPSEGFSPPVR